MESPEGPAPPDPTTSPAEPAATASAAAAELAAVAAPAAAPEPAAAAEPTSEPAAAPAPEPSEAPPLWAPDFRPRRYIVARFWATLVGAIVYLCSLAIVVPLASRFGDYSKLVIWLVLLPIVLVGLSRTYYAAAPALWAADARPAADAPPADFRPTWGRRYIVAPFWAGLLGASVFSWTFAFFFSLGRAGLFGEKYLGLIFFVAAVASVIVTLWRGYKDPIQSYASLFGRIFGALLFGGATAGIVLAILIVVVFENLHVRDLGAFLTIAVMSVLFGGLALLRLYGLGTSRPRRIKIAAATAVVLLATIVPASPSLRCIIGSGDACAAVAADSSDHGDEEDALAYGDRGCSRGFGVACTLAGMALQRGDSGKRDQVGAERMFRRGCALGDDVACDRVHGIELDKRCQRYSAFACKELAENYTRGVGVDRDRSAATRYFQKACLLGDEEACKR